MQRPRPRVLDRARLALGTLLLAPLFLTACPPAEITQTIVAGSTFSVTIESGAGAGSGTIAGSGFNCEITGSEHTGTCTRKIAAESEIIVAATPAEGSVFVSWGGACAAAGTDKCLIKIADASTVSARFDPMSVSLDVQSAGGTGNGTVTGNGLSCTITGGTQSGTCSTLLLPTASVLLTATPASGGHTFTRWVGACSNTSPTCSLIMSQPRIVAANFTAPNSLTILSGGGSGNGNVSGTSGMDCTITGTTQSGVCTGSFPVTGSVTLTATPATGGSTFDGWGGACSGTSATCVVPMSLARTVTARFGGAGSGGGGGGSGGFTLTVASGGGAGSGTVTGSGLNCTITAAAQSGACALDFTSGTSVVLTATPSGTNTFTGWGGACTGTTATCTVAMSQARNVTATFASGGASFTLTITAGAGNGTGNVDGGPISCAIALGPTQTATATGACSASIPAGSTVFLSAAADFAGGGYTFVGWGGACAGVGQCTFSMSQATTVTAKFNAPSLSDVQGALFGPFCSGCHTPGGSSTLLNTANNSLASLVGVATIYRQPGNPYPLATTFPTRVVAYNASNSYVLYQILKQAGSFGMPASATVVPSNVVTLLTNWINGGALAINP